MKRTWTIVPTAPCFYACMRAALMTIFTDQTGALRPDNGLLLFVRVDDFDAARAGARALARLDEKP